MKEWQDEKENEKMVRKRVHSKAYHASFKLAKQCGHSAEEAKALARKAGADAMVRPRALKHNSPTSGVNTPC